MPPTERPVAFIEKQRGAMRIAALSPAAAALGVRPGMALADARAQLPDLETVAHDPSADSQWLAHIADWCDRYTPSVAVDPPDGIILDVTGCIHLFDDEARLTADIEARLAGVHVQTAAAATPEAALAIARCGAAGESLHALPITALRLDPATETALRRAGLTLVGDLAARPSAPLAARFGSETVEALDRLLGRVDSRITPRRGPPPINVERRFAQPLVQTEMALATLEAMVAEAAATLGARGRGARRFVARLYRSDGVLTELPVETGQPTRDPLLVTRLFRERIGALADPLDPGFGFDMIRLAVLALEPLSPTQLALEGGALGEEALNALIDRLSARLGPQRVRCFAARDSHIPEQAAFTFSMIDSPSAIRWPPIAPDDPPLRPLHLFDPPQPIEVIAAVPDGPPRRFRWRRSTHEVARHEGPERIAGQWWRTKGVAPTRDYYRVEDVRGRRFWIFRHGLYDDRREAPGWYIHGLFA